MSQKVPACKGTLSLVGVTIGKEPYCKRCGKELSQKDVDIFGWELGLRDT